MMGPIILATQFTSPYPKDGEEYQRSPSPKISAQKARGLIAATLSVNGEEADKASFDCAHYLAAMTNTALPMLVVFYRS